jgi:glucokinase
MDRRFVVISGLPGSGKTTLGRRLADALKLPLIDKDEILERLFEAKGIGDHAWRRTLSRESDHILHDEAAKSDGAIIVSFWHQPGMAADSGTATRWLGQLSPAMVHVRCCCPADVAARRFFERKRHPGHLDSDSFDDLLESISAIDGLDPIHAGRRIDVDTSHEPELEPVIAEITAAFGRVQ